MSKYNEFSESTFVGRFLNKVAGLQPARDSTQMLSCEAYETFKNTCFEEHLQTTASGGVL